MLVVIPGLNGRTNRLEGVLLLGLYALLAIAFFSSPGTAATTQPVH